MSTEKKFYLLGLLAADGVVSKRRITYTVKNDDFASHVGRILGKEPCKYKVKNGYTNVVSITLPNVCEEILSVYPSIEAPKGNKLTFPNLDLENMRHFVRGYYDGDGTVAKNLRMISITCGEDFGIGLIEYLESNGIKSYLTWNGTNGKRVVINHRSNYKKLFDLLYTNCEFYFSPKKEELYRAFIGYKSQRTDIHYIWVRDDGTEFETQADIAKSLGVSRELVGQNTRPLLKMLKRGYDIPAVLRLHERTYQMKYVPIKYWKALKSS